MEDIKIVMDRIMILNYNLCEYAKKLTRSGDEEFPKLGDQKVDTLESHRIGLKSNSTRGNNGEKKSLFLDLRRKITLIPLTYFNSL